ncbi:MAG: hypothetical protein LC789_09590 [Actinobacteria bacterium]|nr:hypothetical protein [Actinomycetota bacterium]
MLDGLPDLPEPFSEDVLEAAAASFFGAASPFLSPLLSLLFSLPPESPELAAVPAGLRLSFL